MKEKIIDIIKEINPYEEFDIDTDLLESGVLDSMGFLALITELEDVFDIEIDEEDGIYEKLKCVSKIFNEINLLKGVEKW